MRAGYVDLVAGKTELGHIGVPQGGNLSPILSNVYLHELDQFVEDIKNKEESRGISVSIDNPKYKELHTTISNKRQTIRRTKDDGKKKMLLKEVTVLQKVRSTLPSKNTNYDTFQI